MHNQATKTLGLASTCTAMHIRVKRLLAPSHVILFRVHI